MKRLNKEYSLNINDNINVKYGSVDKLNPIVIYVTCKGWLFPMNDFDYNETINLIFNNFKKKLKKNVINSPYFDNNLICDFDLNTASMMKNKKNYTSFDFFIKQKRNKISSLKEIKPIIEETFKGVINDLVNDLNYNTFNLTKTK